MIDMLNMIISIHTIEILINIYNGFYYYSSFYICFMTFYIILLDIDSTNNNSLNKLTASSNYTRPYLLIVPISIIFLILIFKCLIMFQLLNNDYTQEYNTNQTILTLSIFMFSLLSYKLTSFILKHNLKRIINRQK